MHFNRTVIHPDYVGLGLGVKLINKTSAEMKKNGFDVRAKFSSTPVFKALSKHSDIWKLKSIERRFKKGSGIKQNSGNRCKVKTYSYKFIG